MSKFDIAHFLARGGWSHLSTAKTVSLMVTVPGFKHIAMVISSQTVIIVTIVWVEKG